MRVNQTFKAMKPHLPIVVLTLFCAAPVGANPEDRIGEKLVDVSLTTLDGKPTKLLDQHTGKVLVVAYTGVGCPISGRYAPRLMKLLKKNEKKGVRFVGINANPHDSPEKISKDIAELGITFPVLKDVDQELTRQLDAKTTTEVFVVDKDNVIRYRGMIDDQYAVGAQRKNPKNKYLKDAINSVIRGKDVFTKRTVAPGCLITRLKSTSPDMDATYANHIAPIIQENCQQCHRKGQVAPFPLESYEQVRGWSAMIYSVLEENRMPPWNAHPEFDGQFVNQRRLDPGDKQLLMAWIRGGMARGNPEEDPPKKKWPKGWRIGKPHKIFTMQRSFTVPADGIVEYQYFRVPTNFKKDMWISAMEAKPGAADVVHHILAFVVDGKIADADLRGLGTTDGFLCATVPGDTPSIFPKGVAKRLPAGASLWMQIHYTTNGKKRKDKCSIAMIFTEEPVEKEVLTRGIMNGSFAIPPGAENHEVRADMTFDRDTTILSLYPHMHFRGKDWRFIAHYPDGREKTLLYVPQYDYNWQESYIYKNPVVLPKGTRLECVAHFDNSANNFVNPDPTATVRFGEQSWDEMMIGYIDYVAE
ncbi:MAG: redoxin domain-containing protein [Planctomycetota bacterium]|jgi:peroxiredoxin